jgi:predicted hydrocarbon binding protein
MDTLTKDEVNALPTRFDTVPYSTFFKLWYALQKALPAEKKGEILTKIGRTIGKEFDETGIETIDDFLRRLREFLEQEWAITDNAKIDIKKDEEGEVIKILAYQDSCKMCFANTYYRYHDFGSPACMFPQVMMGILSKVKNKFGFRNLRFEGVQKGGVGECAMQWNVK